MQMIVTEWQWAAASSSTAQGQHSKSGLPESVVQGYCQAAQGLCSTAAAARGRSTAATLCTVKTFITAQCERNPPEIVPLHRTTTLPAL